MTGLRISVSRWHSYALAILRRWQRMSGLVHTVAVLKKRQNVWCYTAQCMKRLGGSHGPTSTTKAIQNAYGASWKRSGQWPVPWPGMRETMSSVHIPGLRQVTYLHIVFKFLWVDSRLIVDSSINLSNPDTACTGTMKISHCVQPDIPKALNDERFVGKPRRHMYGRHVTCLVHEIAQPIVHALTKLTMKNIGKSGNSSIATTKYHCIIDTSCPRIIHTCTMSL